MNQEKLSTGKFIMIPCRLIDMRCRNNFDWSLNQIMDIIIRKTYGYNKEKDWITLSQFMIITGRSKPNIVKSITKLIQRKIIIKENIDGLHYYHINNIYSEWHGCVLPDSCIPKDNNIIPQDNNVIPQDNDRYPAGQQALSAGTPTIYNNTKDNITHAVPDSFSKAMSIVEHWNLTVGKETSRDEMKILQANKTKVVFALSKNPNLDLYVDTIKELCEHICHSDFMLHNAHHRIDVLWCFKRKDKGYLGIMAGSYDDQDKKVTANQSQAVKDMMADIIRTTTQ